MDVIRHEHIGMDLAVMIAGRLLETVAVKPEVVLGKERGLSIVAPLDHVLGDTNQGIAGRPGHGSLQRSWSVVVRRVA
jgi:hypothetical protein